MNDHDLLARLVELLDAVPIIRYDRRSAGRGLEYSARRTISSRGHGSAGEAQRERRRTIKRGVLIGEYVLDVRDICRPLDVRWILRPTHDEFLARHRSRRPQQEPFECVLP